MKALELLLEEYRNLFYMDLDPGDVDTFRRQQKKIEQISNEICRLKSRLSGSSS